MADTRIKDNVQSMINQNAPSEDIDGYLKTEGLTSDQFKASIAAPAPRTNFLTGHSISNIPDNLQSLGANVPNAFQQVGKNIINASTLPGRMMERGIDYLSLGKSGTPAGDMVDNLVQSANQNDAAHEGTFGKGLVDFGVDTAATAGLPVAEVAGAAVKPAANYLGNLGMKLAINPTVKQIMSGEFGKAVNVLKDKAVNVSKHGFDSIGNFIDDTNQAIKNVIDIKGAGKSFNFSNITDGLDETVKTAIKNGGDKDELATLNNIYSDFMNNIHIPDDIPVSRAQELKQGIYDRIKKSYESTTRDPVKIQANKAMAMKYKENIANQVPEVADLNALDSNLYTARDLIANRALRGNKSIGLKEFFNSPPSTSYLARQAFKVADAGSLSDKAKLAIAAAIQGGNQALPSNINYLQRQ